MADYRFNTLLSDYTVHSWTARKYDKAASKRIADWAGAKENVGRYNKQLFPEHNESYKIVGAKASASRKVWYSQTLPWNEDGKRILTAANFMNCSEKVGAAEQEFKDALPRFYSEYPEMKAIAEQRLGPLYREEDYPTLEDLMTKFSSELKFSPIPDAADFRVDMPSQARDAIKRQLEADQAAAFAEAMKEPYKRIWDAVTHMASRLQGLPQCPCSNCKTRKHAYTTDEFADTLVDNIKDLCDTLPRLNLTGDTHLDDLIVQVKHGLTAFQPNDLREHENIKQTVAERARAIQAEMSGFMSMMAA